MRATLLLVLSVAAHADWRARFRAGERLYLDGQHEQGRAELQAALSEAVGADRSPVLDALGRTAMDAGRFREAKKCFEEALKVEGHPDERAILLSNAGQTYLALGEHRRAEENFRAGLSVQPENAVLWKSLGQALSLQRRYREADQAWERALVFAPARLLPDLWNDLATAAADRGHHAKAIGLFKRAVSVAAPGVSRAVLRSNLGVSLWQIGEKRVSVESFRLALEEIEATVGIHHPYVAKVLDPYRQVLERIGKKDEARSAARRIETIRASFAGQTNDHRATVDWRDLR